MLPARYPGLLCIVALGLVAPRAEANCPWGVSGGVCAREPVPGRSASPSSFGRCPGCAGVLIGAGLVALVYDVQTAAVAVHGLGGVREAPRWWNGLGVVAGSVVVGAGLVYAGLNLSERRGLAVGLGGAGLVVGAPAVALGLHGLLGEPAATVATLGSGPQQIRIGLPVPLVAGDLGGGLAPGAALVQGSF